MIVVEMKDFLTQLNLAFGCLSLRQWERLFKKRSEYLKLLLWKNGRHVSQLETIDLMATVWGLLGGEKKTNQPIGFVKMSSLTSTKIKNTCLPLVKTMHFNLHVKYNQVM